jgi:hypothetical protein
VTDTYCASGQILRERACHGSEQDIAIDGFGEEVDRAPLDGAHGVWYLPMRRHEDNRHRHRMSRQRGLQLETVLVWQTEVEDDAPGRVRLEGVEKITRTRIGTGFESGGCEESRGPLPCVFIVVDDVNNRTCHASLVCVSG